MSCFTGTLNICFVIPACLKPESRGFDLQIGICFLAHQCSNVKMSRIFLFLFRRHCRRNLTPPRSINIFLCPGLTMLCQEKSYPRKKRLLRGKNMVIFYLGVGGKISSLTAAPVFAILSFKSNYLPAQLAEDISNLVKKVYRLSK